MIVGSLDVRHSASLAEHSGRLWELVGKTPNSLQFTATLNLVTFTMRPVFIYVDHTQSSILTVMTTSPLFAWMFNQEEIVDPSYKRGGKLTEMALPFPHLKELHLNHLILKSTTDSHIGYLYHDATIRHKQQRALEEHYILSRSPTNILIRQLNRMTGQLSLGKSVVRLLSSVGPHHL